MTLGILGAGSIGCEDDQTRCRIRHARGDVEPCDSMDSAKPADRCRKLEELGLTLGRGSKCDSIMLAPSTR